MKKAIIGKKVGMTQIFDETGKVIPVTVIEAGPCVVVQKMTEEKEGYDAVQLGFEESRREEAQPARAGSPEEGGRRHGQAPQGVPPRGQQQARTSATLSRLTSSQKATRSTSPVSAKVRATPALSSASARAVPPPATAAARSPSRRFHGLQHRSFPHLPGQEAGAGHMGVEQVTVQNLDIVKVDAELNMIVIRGAIPGPEGQHRLYQEHRQDPLTSRRARPLASASTRRRLPLVSTRRRLPPATSKERRAR